MVVAAAPTRPPTATATGDGGAQLPPITEVINPADLSDDDDSECEFVPSDDSSSESEDECLLDSIDKDEVEEYNFVKQLQTYDDVGNTFAPTELDDWKKTEAALVERNQRGYYRSKITHAQLYKDMTLAYQPYIQEEMLKQLQHSFSTQRNEAMNQSVASYAPKGKTYSLTDSLDTRVCIAGGIQIHGYAGLWSKIFGAFQIELDDNLRKHLESRDRTKAYKGRRQKSIEGKKLRGQKRYEKVKVAQEEWEEMQRTGMGYNPGMAATTAIAKQKAKENLPSAAERNPKGTAKELLRCQYYPSFCNCLGHSTARSKQCGMHGKSKEEVSAAKKIILSNAVANEIEKIQNSGKYQIQIPGE